MYPQESSAPAESFYAENGAGARPVLAARPRQRYWLHGVLFLATLVTTTICGALMQYDFDRNLPFDIEHILSAFSLLWGQPLVLLSGLPFSLTLMTVLLAHECGHYLACIYYRVDASLPYFLPAPTLGGTFGAFIRIRSAIYSKRALFDIGIAGPLAGFVFLVPALTIGLAFSKIVPGIGHQTTFQFGTPALLWLLEKAVFPGVAQADLYLHPMARAAWIGLLATALNLLPIGQLDGGHILYSLVGERHRKLSTFFIFTLLPLGFFWRAWWLWAVVLFWLGRRHPAIFDPSDLGRARVRLGIVALAIFLLCFDYAPLTPGAL